MSSEQHSAFAGSRPEMADPREDRSESRDSTSVPSPLPPSPTFEVLKNERRREVLRYLDAHQSPVTIGELSDHIAVLESDTEAQRPTSRERQSVYVGLYQCHLPKMDEMDVIEYNKPRGRVALGPNAPRLQRYLDRFDTPARPWPAYYAGMAGLSFSVTAVLFGLGVNGPGVLGATLAAAVCAVAVALGQTHSERGTVPGKPWVSGLLRF